MPFRRSVTRCRCYGIRADSCGRWLTRAIWSGYESAGPEPLVVCHPELTHQVLVNDRDFDKGGPWVDRLREIIGDSVLSCAASSARVPT